jgi:hypothetical protein
LGGLSDQEITVFPRWFKERRELTFADFVFSSKIPLGLSEKKGMRNCDTGKIDSRAKLSESSPVPNRRRDWQSLERKAFIS